MLYRLNERAVGALPVLDEHPQLVRDMFCVPQTAGVHLPYYGHQIIHFGASFNHLSELWHLWLPKFENLLRTMYWLEAHLHLEIELYGNFHYIWKATQESRASLLKDVPLPVDQWIFEGGPRSFTERA